jgi:hypothetical protein
MIVGFRYCIPGSIDVASGIGSSTVESRVAEGSAVGGSAVKSSAIKGSAIEGAAMESSSMEVILPEVSTTHNSGSIASLGDGGGGEGRDATSRIEDRVTLVICLERRLSPLSAAAGGKGGFNFFNSEGAAPTAERVSLRLSLCRVARGMGEGNTDGGDG